MDREARDDDLRRLRRIRRNALRSLEDGNEGARFLVLAVEALIHERENEPVEKRTWARYDQRRDRADRERWAH
jgi:hypothetical protein